MILKRKYSLVKFMAGASVVALVGAAQTAFAQDAEQAAESSDSENVIIVSGIRASLEKSMNIKREGQGVVDAISAEDIGKFPDTNLAESLQRITGVSIDRENGEGSKVTVRGFGPQFNLVILNGRQMPASSLDGASVPSSRSFDFGNLASEGIAGVEVYKTGRANLPTGGIGSVINIKTARPLDRPGFKGSIGVKGVYDNHFEGTKITPEVSGIISKTFADDRIGILLSGSYQQRKGSVAGFSAGWREGYLGTENNWGSLPPASDPRVTNRPGPTDIYQIPQNTGYDFTTFKRERINGQAVLQVAPTDSLTATVDYTFSQNTVDSQVNSVGTWFNHGDVTSSWTDGPVAGPNIYSEAFGPGKDLSFTGAVAANRSINRSLGGNLKWGGLGGLRLELDGHHSTAESKPTSPFGSNIAIGTAIFGPSRETTDFTTTLPVISVEMFPGSEIDASNIRPTGNSLRNAYMRDRINEVALKGGYDFDASFIESLDFGVTYTDNKVRTAYGFLQSDSWGGTLTAAQTPDGLFTPVSVPDRLGGIDGAQDPNIIPTYFEIDTAGLITLLEDQVGICSAPFVGTAPAGSCLADYSVDRRLREKTYAPYIQSTHSFDLGEAAASLRLGLRYEKTKISSSALVPNPTRTVLTGANEIGVIQAPGDSIFTTLDGDYKNWLPAIDFDLSPVDDVKLRASYSHTITRPNYADMQGGITLNSPFRPGGGSTASAGNPGLLPFKSKNIDLSAEWYYDRESYVSVGFFHKNVSNFIASATTQVPQFGLTNPGQGAVYNEAVAAVGANFADVVNYVQANYPALIDPVSGGILSQPSDPAIVFNFSQPINGDQTAKLWGWEFALQHSFWDTGFGTILNYTIVNSNTAYDNTLDFRATQFAVQGVSDSANAVLYYDKNGFQARVAYNWRAGFLGGADSDPYYTNSYGQVDASASYEFKNGLTVFVEGINITESDRSGHRRADQAIFFAGAGNARYAAGARFTF